MRARTAPVVKARTYRDLGADARAPLRPDELRPGAIPEGAPRATLYVSRPLINTREFREWALSQGFREPVPDPHVTLAYSAAHWKVPDLSTLGATDSVIRIGYGGPRAVEPLGDEGATVLFFQSDELERRWKEYLYAGAVWEYDRYRPHVTISCEAGGPDPAAVLPFAGDLVFGPEVVEWQEPVAKAARRRSSLIIKGDPDQPRDADGKWSGSGGPTNISGAEYDRRHPDESPAFREKYWSINTPRMPKGLPAEHHADFEDSVRTNAAFGDSDARLHAMQDFKDLIVKSVTKARRRSRLDLLAAREIAAVSRNLEPRVARAFREAAARMRSAVEIRALAAAIERRDFPEALRLANVTAEALQGAGVEPGRRSFADELTETFRQGGASGMRQLPRAKALAASLDLSNPEAVAYVARTLPERIVEITEETRRAVQAALTRGFKEGRPAIQIAREVRGSVGLTESQAQYVANFRRQLETGRVGGATPPWARRLSAIERQATRQIMDEGGRASQINALVARYEESLINRRARNIARTEVTRAHGAGQTELWRQAEERGLIDREKTRRIWIVTPDDRLREDHAAVPEMNPDGVGLDEDFDTPIGPVFAPRESGDPAFDISCRCTVALEFLD